MDPKTTLSRVEAGGHLGGNFGSLLDDLLTLGQDELDVAGVRHVGVDLGIDPSAIHPKLAKTKPNRGGEGGKHTRPCAR